LRLWVEFADDRLTGTDRIAYVIPGNDDPWAIDEVLESGTRVDACDESVRMIGAHEMVSFGFSNRTPWHTPRELDEDEIYTRLKRLADLVESPGSAIFNIHVPPRDSSLDTAYEVDDELRYVTKGGRPHEVATGSSDYGSGHLDGCLVHLGPDRVVNQYLVSG
jgi:Icc-related predicted phosphoesterase